MSIKLSKQLIKKLMRQSLQQSQKLIKQAIYHRSVLDDPNASQQKKSVSHHRLKHLQQSKKKDKLVMPNLGNNIGDVLDKQGGLAKSILPFKGPKRKTWKNWEDQNLGKK